MFCKRCLHPKRLSAASPLERASRCFPSPCTSRTEVTKPTKPEDGRSQYEADGPEGNLTPGAGPARVWGTTRGSPNPGPDTGLGENLLLSGSQILCPALACLGTQFGQGTGVWFPHPPKGPCAHFHISTRVRGGAEQAGLSHGWQGKGSLLSVRVLFKLLSTPPPSPTLFPSFSSPFYPQSPTRKPLLARAGEFPVLRRDPLLSALVG